MEYLGKDIPKLGFGLMRLPMLGEEVDLEQTKQMVDKFLEAGFTYFDTAYGYLGGKSEEAVKTALVDRYPRESFQLATKLPAWAGAQTAGEAKEMLQTSLRRTGAGYFDFYLLHNCGDDRTQAFDKFGIWDYALEMKEKGLLKHVGFSFHDKADVLDELLTKHPEMEFVQLQINYADWEDDNVQSRRCYEVARKHNKPVIIMEPVKGGALAALPEKAGRLLEKLSPDASQASYAIRFAESLPEVEIVLSGMNTMEQLLDNLACRQPLTEYEQSVLFEAAGLLRNSIAVPCTGCGYCVSGCPKKIHIPEYFRLYNEYKQNPGDGWKIAPVYQNMTASGGGPADCIGCKKCEGSCPQTLPITKFLSDVREAFDDRHS